jgi:hypothetical protein
MAGFAAGLIVFHGDPCLSTIGDFTCVENFHLCFGERNAELLVEFHPRLQRVVMIAKHHRRVIRTVLDDHGIRIVDADQFEFPSVSVELDVVLQDASFCSESIAQELPVFPANEFDTGCVFKPPLNLVVKQLPRFLFVRMRQSKPWLTMVCSDAYLTLIPVLEPLAAGSTLIPSATPVPKLLRRAIARRSRRSPLNTHIAIRARRWIAFKSLLK